ncbi:uncharacterized protein METZ01_LOCUS331577 [marine metagenome]|uniref:Uncharacterized protein n=1 Tax=marine metagenome TaxID=408172 RepID=A0A382PZD5_9ZZZZ
MLMIVLSFVSVEDQRQERFMRDYRILIYLGKMLIFF